MTSDQGKKMAEHAQSTIGSGTADDPEARDAVADQLNGQPRQTLESMKLPEAFDLLIAMTP